MTLSHWQASFDLRFTGSRAGQGQLLTSLRNRANKRPRTLTESPLCCLMAFYEVFYTSSSLAFLPSSFVTYFVTDVVPLQSIAPRPMGSRVERIPIDCLSLGGTPLIPEVTELSLSSLPKRDEVAMFAALMPAT